MIYTLTLNPSIDYVVSVEQFELGMTNRTSKELKYPGGKGINVSRVLKNLGVNSKALGFVGGFTGEFIKTELKKEQVDFDFVEAEGDTRINIKLKTEENETEVNGQSPVIRDKHLNTLKEKLGQVSSGDILVLAGSVPKSLPSSIYTELMEGLKGKGVTIIVDTSGDALKESIKANPFLIKPNHHEIAEFVGKNDLSLEETIEQGKILVKQGVENVFVSMAGNGAVLINKDSVLTANVPRGTVKNSVGAGDSSVAGFIASYQQERSIEKAFKYAIASGSATAFAEGFCTKGDIESLLQEIKIKRVGEVQ